MPGRRRLQATVATRNLGFALQAPGGSRDRGMAALARFERGYDVAANRAFVALPRLQLAVDRDL